MLNIPKAIVAPTAIEKSETSQLTPGIPRSLV